MYDVFEKKKFQIDAFKLLNDQQQRDHLLKMIKDWSKKISDEASRMFGRRKVEAENEFLYQSNIIFTTLCMAGGEKM